MEIAHHLADDFGALAITAGWRETHGLHAVQHTAMRGLEAVAYVGQRPPDDYAHRVIHVRTFHLVFDVDRKTIRRCVWRVHLDVEIPYVERVVLDELPARLDLVAHQRREHLIGFRVILRADLQQRPVFRIHRRRPQRVRIHFAETLVAVHRDALLAGGDEV